MKLNQLTITEALKGLREKKFSARELTESCLKQIKAVDDRVKAFITVSAKEVLEQAKQVDLLINNNPNSLKHYPLLGIPLALKDNYCTKGIKTTAGSNVLSNYFPAYSATVVKKLTSAGAVIIGKTNLDAWAHGSSGENSDFFVTHNPWNLTKIPGGSSSGSTVAVAADECLGAMGTDTGGSIRLPASFCNVVGLKPTYGRVSRFGVIAMASSLDSIGHLTKTVEDSALILKITSGKDEQDATTTIKRISNFKNKKRVKIGLPKEYFDQAVNQEIQDKIKDAAKVLESQGYILEEVSLPHTKYCCAVYYIIQPAEVSSNLARFDAIRYGNIRNTFGNEAKRRIMLGTYTLSAGYYDAYYLKAMKVRSLIIQDFTKVFSQVDLLLAPVSPTLPFDLGEKINDPLQMYLLDILTTSANLAGIPSLALPCGFSVKGLPIGMQIMGPQFSEELLFQVGYRYQQMTDWHKRKPRVC